MLIGIDDSGNFESDKYNLFAAIYIRPRKARQIKKRFEAWEKELPSSAKTPNGEVKGYLLSDDDLRSFIDRIMIDNGYAKIYCSVFVFENSKEQNQSIMKRKERLAFQQKIAEEEYRKAGNGEMANFYHGMHGWMSNLKGKNLRKLELLMYSAFESFRLAPIAAMSMNKKNKHYDRELGLLAINIDNCIIERPQVRKYWEKILADDFWNISYYGKRFYIFTDWKVNHPYIKRFILSCNGENVEFTKEAPECFSFNDSSEYFEIRIADILANLFYRYMNDGTNADLIDILKKSCFLMRQGITLCEFSSDELDRKPPNPFEVDMINVDIPFQPAKPAGRQ